MTSSGGWISWKLVPGVSAAALKRNELADALQVDGLLLLNVDRIGKLYVAAYAHYEIEITVRLYSRESDSIIWEHADEGRRSRWKHFTEPVGHYCNRGDFGGRIVGGGASAHHRSVGTENCEGNTGATGEQGQPAANSICHE